MKTIAVIAEFNPFHNGHLHLIEQCKKDLEADRCVIIMSGDFVQRGAPALIDKFTRTKTALLSGADVCIELPIYYALGSAEYFAAGAVSILDKLGCIDYLCFGSECGEIKYLEKTAEILNKEPELFKSTLSACLKSGQSFASSREKAVLTFITNEDPSISDEKLKEFKNILSEPNNTLALEYIKALKKRNSKIVPYTIKRKGEHYKSETLNEFSSATAIREAILNSPKNNIVFSIKNTMPPVCADLLQSYDSEFAFTTKEKSEKLDVLLQYKLILCNNRTFSEYLDVSEDISNKISSYLDYYNGFDDFCTHLKSKNLAYSRLSRICMHILLDIKTQNMQEYKNDDYTSYARILGMKSSASDVLKLAKKTSSIPIINRLKDADNKSCNLSYLQKRLLSETLNSSKIYNLLYKKDQVNEYRIKQIIF
ncbi:MAG: nucleotidyltransferase [Butyrivibrio sp.]|nr:nucleotidyltransferase [Butyrivibrio sp.]